MIRPIRWPSLFNLAPQSQYGMRVYEKPPIAIEAECLVAQCIPTGAERSQEAGLVVPVAEKARKWLPRASPSVIRGIDHVLIHTQDLERVFARFRNEFGLPVVWPISDYGPLVSGGLRAGNVTIEIGRFTGYALPGTRFYGLGFAPNRPTWEMVKGLADRGLPHTPPITIHYQGLIEVKATLTFLRDLLDGPPNTSFWMGRRLGGDTRIGRALSTLSTWIARTETGSQALTKLLGDSMAFMCEYHVDRHPERLAELMADWQRTRQGGPYGITGVAGVDIEISTNVASWRSLLDRPDLTAHSIHAFSMGPPLRFHAGVSNRLMGLEFSCADLRSTARKLIDNRWVSVTDRHSITVAPERVDGLTLRFSQAPTHAD